MSAYFDILGGAMGSALNDTTTLADIRPEYRTAAIAAGITLGLCALACPGIFALHSVANLTAAGVRQARRDAGPASAPEHAPGDTHGDALGITPTGAA